MANYFSGPILIPSVAFCSSYLFSYDRISNSYHDKTCLNCLGSRLDPLPITEIIGFLEDG